MPPKGKAGVGEDAVLSLFHVNYDKPGPGVKKDEPKKNAVVQFFSLFFRKFFQLIELNLLFIIFVIAALVITYFTSNLLPAFLLTLVPVLIVSPFLAGITFVTRNYARQEHAFLVSDFFDAVKQNWKAFLVNGIVCCVLYYILGISIQFYFSQLSCSMIYTVAFSLCIAIACILIFAQYYVPLMIVTFDLKLIQIYKNALIFSVLGLWRNLLLTVLLAVLAFGIYLSQIMAFTFAISILFVALLFFSLSFFLINFMIYPLVNRTMIQPHQDNQSKEHTPDSTDQ
ncbi:MAG: YesL family protein [Oscillospiraceae bacterium]|nr:YesL family protein [Oscillospiraceae bacterium]